MGSLAVLFLCLFLSCCSNPPMSVHSHAGIGFNPPEKFTDFAQFSPHSTPSYAAYTAAPQDGLKAADKIDSLPGQPEGVDFEQYAGHVTVDQTAGRALFYYFVESQNSSSTKPLLLWLNGGPGCSSLGAGAFMELGPFRVNSDGLTLSNNKHAWSTLANVVFLESPAGVGFSYSNTTSDYDKSSDERTAKDAYVFLVNWLERFPEYKGREFYIAGESYAGHYVPQLAQLIMRSGDAIFNLKGIAIGNGYVDYETRNQGFYHFLWSHALIPDEIYNGIVLFCNFSSETAKSNTCEMILERARAARGNIYSYDIYAPLCNSSYSRQNQPSRLDPCIDKYIHSYLNIPDVQKALHANVTNIPGPWQACNEYIFGVWNNKPPTVLPVIKELMGSTIRVWLYSGDTDGQVPITTTKYAIDKLQTVVKTQWYPWYSEDEVGGYAVGYENLTFVTIRGAGHFVPGYQPARALAVFSSFLEGKLP